MVVALIVTDEIAENQRYLFHPRARKEDRRRERKTRTTEREGCGFSGNVGQVSEVRLFPVSMFVPEMVDDGGRVFVLSVLQFEG